MKSNVDRVMKPECVGVVVMMRFMMWQLYCGRYTMVYWCDAAICNWFVVSRYILHCVALLEKFIVWTALMLSATHLCEFVTRTKLCFGMTFTANSEQSSLGRTRQSTRMLPWGETSVHVGRKNCKVQTEMISSVATAIGKHHIFRTNFSWLLRSRYASWDSFMSSRTRSVCSSLKSFLRSFASRS